jgi:hypothetical protein
MFQITDFFRSYTKRGETRGIFNIARSDEAAVSPRYYLYLNQEGSYIIQKVVETSDVSVFTYYATRHRDTLATDWANRASLTYVEYYELFNQGD